MLILFIAIGCILYIFIYKGDLFDFLSWYIKLLCFVVASLALVISIINTQLSIRAMRNAAILSANVKLCEYEYKIAENIKLLRFHIDEEPEIWLQKYGLTQDEFAYLLASFSISSALYNTSPVGQQLVEIGSYRDNMFKTKAMQKAWPAIKEMLGSKEFIEKMDVLYNLHKR